MRLRVLVVFFALNIGVIHGSNVGSFDEVLGRGESEIWLDGTESIKTEGAFVNSSFLEIGNTKTRVPFNKIPIVDMSLPLNEVANAVRRACLEVGFFYVINHSVPEVVVENLFWLSKMFFQQPQETKIQYLNSFAGKGLRGYFTIGQEDLQGNGFEEATKIAQTGDLKEGYECGREAEDSDPSKVIMGENVWPDVAGFREGMLEYQASMQPLVDELLVAFAVSLGLDSKEYFINKSRRPMSTLRLLRYPPQEVRPEQVLGCGEHTDYGLMTILLQDRQGGLQIRNTAGKWVDAPPIPGTFVVNVGDMMSRWTGGRYASTVHRVINQSGEQRFSAPYFFNPDADAIVENLIDGSSKGELAAEILKKRYDQSFKET